MIALISFTDDLVMTRDEANQLHLQYAECDRFGLKDGTLKAMSPDYYYRDEVTKNGDDWYIGDKKIQYSWYIYDRPAKCLDWVFVKRCDHLVNLELFIEKCNYPFTIVKAIKQAEPSIQNIQSILNTIGEKIHQIDSTIDIMGQQTFNQKVNVHVGGGLIVTYNDLCLKEDCCTDMLQSELNNGWRIIAVCVQPDQRRPDYVLGRYNPELDVLNKTDAKR